MPVIQVEARLSPEQILDAVGQMSPDEIASFANRVIELRARRVAPLLSAEESPLLERINRAPSPTQQALLAKLLERRDASALTEAEHAQLIELSDALEMLDTDRLAALAELAGLRRVSLTELMASLSARR